MESPNRQAVRLLREQRKRRKMVAAFLCMAGLVVIGTVMALRMNGRAMNNQVLDCVLTHELTHQHTESCYYTPPQEGAQKVLVCGMADFVVHKHGPEKCFDKMGNLICMLPEIEEHVHTVECYQEQKVLSCKLQEGDGGHLHSDSCYGSDYSAEPVCGLEENSGHTHSKDCYGENEQLICGQVESEEHTHTDSCYPRVLTCGMEVGTGGHVHSEACYTMESISICGKREVHLHTHNEECYLHDVDKPDQAQVQELAGKGIDINQITFVNSEELPSEKNRVLDQSGAPILKCGQLQVLEHIHGDNCYIDVDTEGKLVSQLGSGSEGVEMPGQRTAVYQGASMRVTAIYEGEDFPENARINVERVDEDGGLPEKQEQLNNAIPDRELQLMALLKVTVSGIDDVPVLSEPIRLLVEPTQQGKVTAAAWYDSSESLSEQGIYVQSEEPKLELLEVTEQENNEFAAVVYPGALVGIAQQPVGEENSGKDPAEDNSIKDEQNTDNVTLNISQSFEYEDDDYTMIFSINGIARPKAGGEQPVEAETEAGPEESGTVDTEDAELSEPEDDTDTDAASENGGAIYFPEPSAGEDQSEEDTEADDAEPDVADELADTAEPGADVSQEALPTARTIFDTEPAEATTNIEGDILPANVLDDPENPLGLMVERLAEDSAEYEMYADYAENEDTENGLPGLKVMSYTLYYKGIELDISECTVTLDITAKEKLVAAAAALEEEQGAMAAEGVEAPSVAMLTIVPVETAEDDAAEGEEEEVYYIPATRAMLDQVDLETKLLDIANENVSSDSPVKANAAIALGSQSETRTVRTVLRTAGQKSGSIEIDKDHFGVTADTKDNPRFTVQYYALLDVVKKDGSDLKVINTRGGNLPQNGTGTDKNNSPNTNQLMGLNIVDNKVQKTPEWHEIFSEVPSYYIQRPNLEYFKPVGTETFYDLQQIWILKDGKDSTIADYSADNWDVYGLSTFGGVQVPNSNKITSFDICHFTNKPHKLDEDSQPIPETDWYTPFLKEGEWYFPIKEGAVIRLIYKPSSGDNSVKANFYDYDISSGHIYTDVNKAINNNENGKTETAKQQSNTLYYAYTKETGINGAKNYSGTGTKLAFGNVNTGTSMGENLLNGNLLNKYNGTQTGHPTVTGSYEGCTFGLVTGLEDGKIQYAASVDAPNLFNDGDATGKTSYDNGQYSLEFNRVGDTYTLTAVNGTEATNLDSFNHPSPYSGKTHSIWTNNFWPMDSAGSYGTDGHDMKFGSFQYRNNRAFAGSDTTGEPGSTASSKKTFPYSDDGKDHNSYFGMNFSVTFDLTTEYKGPLEYLFFGDDDMWVFLTPMEEVLDENNNPVKDEEGNTVLKESGDSQLICDIGGVHSSVGEYVDLWDYVGKDKGTVFVKNPNYVSTKDDPEEHGIAHYKLDFFYTERGASGSTCWMQYTLPSVRSATSTQTEDELRRLEIKKEVTRTPVSGEFSQGNKEPYNNSNDEFLFKLTLNNAAGKKLVNNYSYFKYSESGNTGEGDNGGSNYFDAVLLDPDVVSTGAYFTLKNGEYIVIDHLPVGTQFTIEEYGAVTYSLNGITSDGKIELTLTDGEHDYDVSATIKQGNGSGQPMDSETNSEGHKVFSGTIQDNISASVLMDNNFKTYELPKTGGIGTWGFTGAGALMILAAGCLLVRKRTKKN